MLSSLHMKNLVLIDSCTIHFERGLNILTGETGAGKTVLIQGVHLLIGRKADKTMIRRGCEKATIEATFEHIQSPLLSTLLQSGGVEWDASEPLILKREITIHGKNHSFINCQRVTLSFLKNIEFLIF